MARAMPVLPEVGSRMVAPWTSRPSRSAASIMARAGRSLIEPVGLRSSSLAQRRTLSDGESLGRPTSGVSPTAASRESYRATTRSAPGDGGQDGHRVPVGHLGVQATGEAYVLV